MADKKEKTENATMLNDATVHATSVEEVQMLLENEYRTDHLTLPALAPLPNEERAKASAIERKAILDESGDDDIVMDTSGITRKELREQIQFGIMGKDAPKEAKDGIGKHTVELGKDDGKPAVIVTAPNDTKVVISEPTVVEDDVKTPAGMEAMHSTSPVPTQNQVEITPEKEVKKSNGDSDKK